MSGNFDVLNTRPPRLDAPDKATGRAVYVDDMFMPDMLHGALLQSPLAHARILNIDVSQALKMPGVKAVLTAKEVGLTRYGVSPARYDETLFAHDKVRYIGDEIAAVAAVDLETALEAVEKIKVDYEELPTVMDPWTAMAEGAPHSCTTIFRATSGPRFTRSSVTWKPPLPNVISSIPTNS